MKVYFLSTFLFLTFLSKSAIGDTFLPVKVGEKVPDIYLGKLINYRLKTAKVSDFHGRLIILDFWNVHCVTCIKQFPKLERLQEKFGNKILILPVGFDEIVSIQKFYQKRIGTTYEMKLPTVIQEKTDTIIKSLFPFETFPHEIWIDPNGIFIGATEHNAVTEGNIQSILNGKIIQFESRVNRRPISGTTPFLLNNQAKSFTYGSAFTGYIDSIKNPYFFGRQFDSSTIRLFDVNQTVFTYYKQAYGYTYKFLLNDPRDKRLVIENVNSFYKDWKDVSGLDNWNTNEFRKKNLFCYELILPNSYLLIEAYQKMIKDLDWYFRIDSKIEKRRMPHLALIRNSNVDKIMSTANNGHSEFSENQLNVRLRSESIDILLNHLDNLIDKYPIIDKTNYRGKIDLDINLPNNYSLDQIRSSLRVYDLDLIFVEDEIDVLKLYYTGYPSSQIGLSKQRK